VCDECQKTVTKPEDVLGDGLARIVDSVLRLYAASKHVATTLRWTTTTGSDDWKALQAARPS
jgi:hypothetical protein